MSFSPSSGDANARIVDYLGIGIQVRTMIEYYFQFLSKHTKSIMVTYLLPNSVDRLLSVEVEGGSSLAVEEGDRVRRARASLRREREFFG